MSEQTETIGGLEVTRRVPNSIEDFNYRDPLGIDLYELEQKRGAVPDMKEAARSFNVDRTTSTGTGPYQVGLRFERQTLIEDMTKFMDEINRNKRNVDANDITREDIQNIRYVPNSRFAYYNRLLRDTVAKKKCTQGDLDYVKTVWMNDDAKDSIRKILALYNDRSQGFSVLPTPSRSGMRYTDAPGDKLALRLANPGTINFPVSMVSSKYDTKTSEILVNQLEEKIKRAIDQFAVDTTYENLIPFNYTNPKNAVIQSLVHLRDKLMLGKVSLSDILRQSEALHTMFAMKDSKYLNSLANPFRVRNARIPSLISPPSAVFSLKSMVPLTTNALGNVAFMYTPFYLANPAITTLGINNNVGLNGSGPSNFFLGVAIGQQLPAAFYTKYRLVSAGLRVYLYPSSNNDNGILTVSTTFDRQSVGNVGNVVGDAAFGDFQLMENGYFKQTTTIASREVQEHVYIPIDESNWDFQNISTIGGGMSWTGYITGAPASATIARLEIVANYEALLDNEFTDYLPSECAQEDLEPKQIFGTLSKMRRESGTLNEKTVKDAIKDSIQLEDMSKQLTLPKPKTQTNVEQNHLNDLLDVYRNVTKHTLDKLSPPDKQNWIVQLMETLSPTAFSLINGALPNVNGMFLPKMLY